MKNKFSSLIRISLFLIFPKAYSQTLLTINDELANELISKRSIFPVNQINVEYYPLVTGKVESRQYANILQRKKAYEENYLSYVKSKNENEKSYNNKN